MDNAARESYLKTQLTTATPQKLRLLLICGAIRFAQQTMRHWEENDSEAAFESLTRCRGVVVELMTTVRRDDDATSYNVFKIYLFLFQALTAVQHSHDAEEMRKILNVLDEERQTWEELCELMPEAPDPALRKSYAPQEVTAAEAEIQLAANQANADLPAPHAGGFDTRTNGGLPPVAFPAATPQTPSGGFTIEG